MCDSTDSCLSNNRVSLLQENRLRVRSEDILLPSGDIGLSVSKRDLRLGQGRIALVTAKLSLDNSGMEMDNDDCGMNTVMFPKNW